MTLLYILLYNHGIPKVYLKNLGMELIINHTKKFENFPKIWKHLLWNYLKKKGIAVALNNRIIPQSFWAETFLNDKDSVLIITATQGG
jgi:sulfur carrier protein